MARKLTEFKAIVYDLWHDGSYMGSRWMLKHPKFTIVGNDTYDGPEKARKVMANFCKDARLGIKYERVDSANYYNADFLL